jgi:hypothetical protein
VAPDAPCLRRSPSLPLPASFAIRDGFFSDLLRVGRLLRLSPGGNVTVGVGFDVPSAALAWAIGVTLLKRVAYAVSAVLYFFTRVPPLFSCEGASRLLVHKDALLPRHERRTILRPVALSRKRRH